MMQIEAPRCCRGYQELHLLEGEGMVFGHAYGDQTGDLETVYYT